MNVVLKIAKKTANFDSIRYHSLVTKTVVTAFIGTTGQLQYGLVPVFIFCATPAMPGVVVVAHVGGPKNNI